MHDGMARTAGAQTHDNGATLARSRRYGALHRRPCRATAAVGQGGQVTAALIPLGAKPAAVGSPGTGCGIWWGSEPDAIRTARGAGVAP